MVRYNFTQVIHCNWYRLPFVVETVQYARFHLWPVESRNIEDIVGLRKMKVSVEICPPLGTRNAAPKERVKLS